MVKLASKRTITLHQYVSVPVCEKPIECLTTFDSYGKFIYPNIFDDTYRNSKFIT